MNTDKRTDDELNRIIAEWCGWRFVPEHDVLFPTPAGHVMPEGWIDPEGKPYSIPPNYCCDLNAVHEAETHEKWHSFGLPTEDYEAHLEKLTRADCRKIWNATARQRAEALVKVIEEGKK